MTIVDGDILQASARFTDPKGNDHVNVYHFEAVLTDSQTDQTVFDEIDAFLTSVYTEFDSYLMATAEPRDLKVDVIDWVDNKWTTVRSVGFGSWGAGINTSSSGDQLPPGVAALVKFGTGFGRHIGRKFIGMMPENLNQTNGTLSATLIGAMATGFGNLLVGHEISSLNYLNYRVLDRLEGTVYDALELIINGIWSYQRRRREGVGS